MNTATDDPMFFTPTDLFDELPITSHYTSHSSSINSPPPASSHHSEKLQFHVYLSSAAEWPFQYPLDPSPAKIHHEPIYMPDHPQQQFSTKQQPPSTLGSSIDINPHFTYPSPTGYVDINNTASWIMNSLDSNTYLPDFSPSLGFYEENPNDFHSYQPPHPYISQETPLSSSSSSLPSYFMSSSYSQHNLTDLFDSTPLPLPDEYVNANCTESFPNLPHSFTNQALGHEVQSFLGYMPRESSPYNTSKILSHSNIDPEPPNSYPDINEGMDDLSDSDTTTSTQSWMMPLPQVPFHNGHDDDLSTPTFQPVGGMVSSISTPVFGLDHSHPHSHLLQQQQPSQYSVPPISGRQPMKYKSKKLAKTSTKQQQKQQQQQQDKVHRSNSSHAIHSSSNSSRNNTIHNQQNALKRRVSEPYLLNTVHSFPTTTTMPCPPATKTVPASESIASILGRQRLSDLEEEMENDPFGQSQQRNGLVSRRHQHQKTNSRHKHKPGPRRCFVEGEANAKSNNDSDDNDPNGHKMQPPPPPPNQPIKKGRNVDKACNHCKRSHLRCDSMRPCRRCIVTGKSGCQDVEHKPRGRPRLHQT